MALSDVVHTFGQWLQQRHGERVHKIALDAGFTCPNRDGNQGVGGCTFCNNASFSPNVPVESPASPAPLAGEGGGQGTQPLTRTLRRNRPAALEQQLADGCAALAKRSRKYLAYFQAYTNTYADVQDLKALYDEALGRGDVIGLSVGTRPDCVPAAVLDLLCSYRDKGYEVWLELGLQSAFDATLQRVNRGHGWQEYEATCRVARQRGLPVCAHLILGLPGETDWHYQQTLARVLDTGVDGLKLHPLHVVRQTVLANQWRRGEYTPLGLEEYVDAACDLIAATPWDIPYHRVTGTAPAPLLLTPDWCVNKWPVINAIELTLKRRGQRQGSALMTAGVLNGV